MVSFITQLTIWLRVITWVLECAILLLIVYYHVRRRKGAWSNEVQDAVRGWAKKGGIACFAPAALLLIAALILQSRGILALELPFQIALLIGGSIWACGFFRLLRR